MVRASSEPQRMNAALTVLLARTKRGGVGRGGGSGSEAEVLVERHLVLAAAVVLIRARDRPADAVVHEEGVGQERLAVREPVGREEDREGRGLEATQHAAAGDHVACGVGRDSGNDRAGTHRDVSTDRDRREHLERHLDHAPAGLRVEVDVARAARLEEPGGERRRGREVVAAHVPADVVDAVQFLGGAVGDEHAGSDRAFERQEASARVATLEAVDRRPGALRGVPEPVAADVGDAVPDAARVEPLVVVNPAVAVVVDAVVRRLDRVRGHLAHAIRRPLGGASALVGHAVARGAVALPDALGVHRAAVAVAGLAGLAGAVVLDGGVGGRAGVGRARIAVGGSRLAHGQARLTGVATVHAGASRLHTRAVGAEPEVAALAHFAIAAGGHVGRRHGGATRPDGIGQAAPGAEAAHHARRTETTTGAAVDRVRADAARLVLVVARCAVVGAAAGHVVTRGRNGRVTAGRPEREHQTEANHVSQHFSHLMSNEHP